MWADGDWQGPVVNAGAWEKPADAHVKALRQAGLRPDVLVVGLVGTPARRREARAWFRDADLARGAPEFTEADTGFEQVTVAAVRDWAAAAEPGTPVLYAHSKGAYNLSPVTAKHREIMTGGVVGRWRAAVTALKTHDVAGCFWNENHFTGNFWWANAGYLAALPPVSDATRFEAETWLGLGHPRAYEMARVSYQEVVEAIIGRPEPGGPPVVTPPGVFPLGAPAPPASITQGRAMRFFL